jgi:hypothetical protein
MFSFFILFISYFPPLFPQTEGDLKLFYDFFNFRVRLCAARVLKIQPDVLSGQSPARGAGARECGGGFGRESILFFKKEADALRFEQSWPRRKQRSCF